MTSETARPTNKHLVTLILLLLCSYPAKRLSSPLTGTARSIHLDRRTPHRPVGAKYATVSGLRSQLNATARTLIDDLASINRHPLCFRPTTMWARNDGVQNYSAVALALHRNGWMAGAHVCGLDNR